MKLKVLLANLIVYQSNFRMLHWLSKGSKFDNAHENANNVLKQITDDIDDVAEMLMMLDQKPLCIGEAIGILRETDDTVEYSLLNNEKEYDFKEGVEISSKLLKDICKTIEIVLQDEVIKLPENIGIKADLESKHLYYDKQRRYLNARRKK